jgi:hypothetical protein
MTELFNLELSLEEVEEHEDGSATYSVTTSKDADKVLRELGLKLTLYCAAYGVDIQTVLANIPLLETRQDKENTKEDTDLDGTPT